MSYQAPHSINVKTPEDFKDYLTYESVEKIVRLTMNRQGARCPVCGKAWVKRKKDATKHLEFGAVVFKKMKDIEDFATFIRASIAMENGLCPLCLR